MFLLNIEKNENVFSHRMTQMKRTFPFIPFLPMLRTIRFIRFIR